VARALVNKPSLLLADRTDRQTSITQTGREILDLFKRPPTTRRQTSIIMVNPMKTTWRMRLNAIIRIRDGVIVS